MRGVCTHNLFVVCALVAAVAGKTIANMFLSVPRGAGMSVASLLVDLFLYGTEPTAIDAGKVKKTLMSSEEPELVILETLR